MSVKIYSTYDEFKFEEEEVCEYLESTESDYDDDSDKDMFFYTESKSNIDDSSFYIIADSEDEDLAEDVANYLGKPNKFFLVDLHKTVFIIK